MPIPESERTIYGHNPLEEVVCQLSFSPILRIGSEIPVAFQEALRSVYPKYQQRLVSPVPIPQQILMTLPGFPSETSYEFATKDDVWTITLNKTSIALTCRAYEKWEEFEKRLQNIFDVCVNEYHPGDLTRIGLRYKNVIRRSRFNVAEVRWSQLLNPQISAELGSADLAEDEIELSASQAVLRLRQYNSRVQIQHGLAKSPSETEILYVIDSDFFTQQPTEASDVKQRLSYFNKQAGCLFRWCITTKLHDAMGPKPLR